LSFKASKRAYMTKKLFLHKLANKKVIGKTIVQNWSLSSFILQLAKFMANNFLWDHLFQLLTRILNQRKILRIFNTHMQKKKEFFFGSLSTVHRWEFFWNQNANSQEKA
jgi:hypothetical protein